MLEKALLVCYIKYSEGEGKHFLAVFNRCLFRPSLSEIVAAVFCILNARMQENDYANNW